MTVQFNTQPMEGELLDAASRCLTNTTLIKVGEMYYNTMPLISEDFSIDNYLDPEKDKVHTENRNTFKLRDDTVLNDETAYLIGEYYYLFRGNITDQPALDPLKPGIYFNPENYEYIICNPESEEEKNEYRYADKITTYDADAIREAVFNRKVVIINTPDVVHSTIPPESTEDDILKRLVKRAFIAKGLDIDQCRSRFISKNTLFNFKSVIRGDMKLSMLLFDRGMDALNLKYTIILEEAGGELVGKELADPIIISSEDVYDTFLDSSQLEEA